MGKLINQANKSNIMDIALLYDGEEIVFNLAKELKIREVAINDELHNHPRIYGFLSMLHKKLVKKAKDQKLKSQKVYNQLWSKYKALPGEGNRARSKDLAEADTLSDNQYLIQMKKLYQIEHDRDVIESCVKSMEVKAELIRTLSANMRKEV